MPHGEKQQKKCKLKPDGMLGNFGSEGKSFVTCDDLKKIALKAFLICIFHNFFNILKNISQQK